MHKAHNTNCDKTWHQLVEENKKIKMDPVGHMQKKKQSRPIPCNGMLNINRTTI